MPIVHIEDIDDEIRRLDLSTGDSVELRCEDESVGVYAGDDEVGRLSFRLIEEPISPYEEATICRLTHAFIEGGGGKYQKHGIGTEAVRFYLECTGHTLELPENDGLQKDDGSHLVNLGPVFVASLRKKMDRGELL
jgi:hypothetical protein